MSTSPAPTPEIHVIYIAGEGGEFPTSHHGRGTHSEKMREASLTTNTTLTNDQNVPIGRANPTLEIPTVRPGEIAPTRMTAILSPDDPHELVEIHGAFGASGMIAAQFSVTQLDRDYPHLTYSPGEPVEREIFPDSHEYHIRMQQFHDFAKECQRNGFSSLSQRMTPDTGATSLLYIVEPLEASANAELSQEVLPKITEALNRGLSRGLSF